MVRARVERLKPLRGAAGAECRSHVQVEGDVGGGGGQPAFGLDDEQRAVETPPLMCSGDGPAPLVLVEDLGHCRGQPCPAQ